MEYGSSDCPVLELPESYRRYLRALTRQRAAAPEPWSTETYHDLGILFYEAKEDIERRYKRLGSGRRRTVYDNGGCVFKLDERTVSNLAEWRAWERLKGTPRAKHFAPALALLDNGEILLMQKAQVSSVDAGPALQACRLLKQKKEEVRCDDLHWQNVGFIDGEPVLIDYEDFSDESP